MNPQVVDDILLQLKLTSPLRFKNPCFRSNLFYDVCFKELLDDPYTHLYDFCINGLGEGWQDMKKVTHVSRKHTLNQLPISGELLITFILNRANGTVVSSTVELGK